MSVGHRAVRGAAWTIFSSVGGRIVGLIGTLVLTRFIAPDEYGAVSAVAAVLVYTADELTRLGIFQYIVAKPESGPEAAFHCTVYHVSIGLVALGVVVLLRNPFAALAGSAAAAAFVPGMALAALFDRLATAPERVLARDLRFRNIGIARGVTEVIYATSAVALAIWGLGGDAIVYGNVVQWGIFMLMLMAAVRFSEWLKPTPLRKELTKKIFAFGLPLSVGHSANFASRRWDNLLIARFFGDAVAGRYALAYNLADIPATHVGEHIGDVLLPSFARMDHEKRKSSLVRATALLSLIMFPLAVGLGTVAPALTAAIFNETWAQMGPMLAVLAALSVVRPIGWTISSYLQARDQPRAVMVLEIVKVVCLLIAVAALAQFSVLWACAGVGVAFGINALTSMWMVKRLDGIPLFDFAKAVIPPLIACAPLAGAVLGADYLLRQVGWVEGPSKLLRVVALVLEIGAGALVFVPSALILAPTVSKEFIRLIKEAILRRGGESDEDDDDEDEGAEGAGE